MKKTVTPSGQAETSVDAPPAKEKEVPMYRVNEDHDRKSQSGAASDNQTREVPPVVCKGYCGELNWTIEKYGRATHKCFCPRRADPWCQSHPDWCAQPVAKAKEFDALREKVLSAVDAYVPQEGDSPFAKLYQEIGMIFEAAGRAASGGQEKLDKVLALCNEHLQGHYDDAEDAVRNLLQAYVTMKGNEGESEVAAAPAPAQLSEEQMRLDEAKWWLGLDSKWGYRSKQGQEEIRRRMAALENALTRSQPAGKE